MNIIDLRIEIDIDKFRKAEKTRVINLLISLPSLFT